MKSLFTTVLLAGLACSFSLVAQEQPTVQLDLDNPLRTAEEKARDINRKPQETLSFFGLQPDMRVIELFPGQGWYTKLLAPLLADEGQLYLAIATDRVKDKLPEWGLNKVMITGDVQGFTKTDLPGFIFSVDSIDLLQRDVDMVLTFRNAHNFTEQSREKLNAAVFAALKPGGIYGVIDHSRRHMEPLQEERWRRVDPVQIIKEAVAAGFEFVDYSSLHARPEDSLQFDTLHVSLPNESDRFTLKFRKPFNKN